VIHILAKLASLLGIRRFFMSETSTDWCVSNVAENRGSADGDGVVTHIVTAWDCYFTDGEYVNRTGTDNSVQLGLLNFHNAYTDPDMVCILTIDD